MKGFSIKSLIQSAFSKPRQEEKPRANTRAVMDDFASNLDSPEYSRLSEISASQIATPVIVRQTAQSSWASMAPVMEVQLADPVTNEIDDHRPVEPGPVVEKAPPRASESSRKSSSWEMLDWGEE